MIRIFCLKPCARFRFCRRHRARRAFAASERSATCCVLRSANCTVPLRVPADIIALPAGAPFGAVAIDAEGCTLCLSCVSACPTSALRDDPERPALRFVEDACVQCGLCQATCPEDVITLVPRINFDTSKVASRILKEEEPFCCIRCGKPFGVKSSIERVMATLKDKHWMYKGSPSKLDIIKMCDNCRVGFVAEQGFESYGTPPTVRTTDDYLRERETGSPRGPKDGRD